ncbi:MAG: squalene synthase HpnC [Burkholderiales bacterium]|nr:squalene synthase HpnC [Burkholderiales bacterium]
MPLASTDHYENFPVGSLLLPRRLRQPIADIYRYARSADDIADEGDADGDSRLAQLDNYREELHRIAAGIPPKSELFASLDGTINEHALPIALFHDLLDAFSQDVVKKRYTDFVELMDYCRRSANPIGRLLLHLFKQPSAQNLLWSDAICSSLQLINFCQDVAVDWRKRRLYLPLDEMAAHGVTEAHIATGQVDARWQRLMRFQSERAGAMLRSGAPLGSALPGRMGIEVRAIVAGGAAILAKIDAVDGDVFRRRPTLHFTDWPFIFARAIFPPRQST